MWWSGAGFSGAKERTRGGEAISILPVHLLGVAGDRSADGLMRGCPQAVRISTVWPKSGYSAPWVDRIVVSRRMRALPGAE